MKAPILMLELRGESVKGIIVYERIHESKRLGYSKQKTAERLQCCWRSVDKYWDMTFDDYRRIESKVRKESVLEHYDAHIISRLTRHPDMSVNGKLFFQQGGKDFFPAMVSSFS